MQKLKWIALGFLLFGTLWTNAQELSPRAEISVLTFGPGPEVYSIWGHTAIRVYDPDQRLDKVYNYGTYDFDTPNFLMKFIRGKLDYALSQQRYYRVVAAYKKENRWIKEQVMNLRENEKLDLYLELEENYQPENRYYKYDWLFDNCATRPLQIIEANIEDPISFFENDILSYRDILDEHLIHNPWADFGIDLVVGSIADQKANARQQMFMPIYIYRYFSSAAKGTGEKFPLVKSERVIAEEGNIDWANTPSFLKPLPVLLFLFIIELMILFWSVYRKKRMFRAYDHFWYVLTGLGSLLLLFMWFGTDHIPTKKNWNLLWMNPLFLLFLFFKERRTRKILSVILFIVLLATLACWSLIPQEYHIAVLPLVGILGIKCYKEAFLKY